MIFVLNQITYLFLINSNIIHYIQRCREEDPTLITRYKPRRTDQDDRKHKKYNERERGYRYEYDAPYDPNVEKKSSKRCGECTGCLRTENCGKCDACR